MFQKLIVVTALTQGTEAAMQFGKCPKVNLVAPFNAAGLQGKWYTTHIDWQFPMTIGAQCITQEYSTRSDGNFDLLSEPLNLLQDLKLVPVLSTNAMRHQMTELAKPLWVK